MLKTFFPLVDEVDHLVAAFSFNGQVFATCTAKFTDNAITPILLIANFGALVGVVP